MTNLSVRALVSPFQRYAARKLCPTKNLDAGMAAYGIPETDISRVVAIDPKTLRKCYRDEFDLGQTKANVQVAGFLSNSARSGNVAAQIFWLKTRAQWRETASEHRHTGAFATFDLRELSDEALERIVFGGAPSSAFL